MNSFAKLLILIHIFHIFVKKYEFHVVFSSIDASNGYKTNKFNMEKSEKEFEKIVREHKNTIYTVCFMFSKDNDEVNDLFQEILINLWQGFKGFRGYSSMRTWIWRVSLNTWF